MKHMRMYALFVSGASIAALFATSGLPEEHVFRLSVLAFVLLTFGSMLGAAAIPRAGKIAQWGVGFALAIAVQSVAQTALYYLGVRLGTRTDAWSLATVVLVALALHFFAAEKRREERREFRLRLPAVRLRGIVLLLFSVIVFFRILGRVAASATTESILTPWPLLPEGTLGLVALMWGLLLASIIFVRSPLYAALQSGLTLFSVAAIVPLVYRIGFGFDGFLHIASEQIIRASGTLEPRPFYYIGQYVFTTWLSRFTAFPIQDIDRWLVPAGAAALIPLTLYVVVRGLYGHPGGNAARFSFLLIPLLPLGTFAATTPQHLSYLLSICALILLVGVPRNIVRPLAPLALAAWALAAHPLAGLPILFVILAALAVPRSRILGVVFTVAAGVSIPAAFWFLGIRSGTPIDWNLGAVAAKSGWLDQLSRLQPWVGNRFVLWPAWAELASRATFVLFFLLGVGSAVLRPRRPQIVLVSSAALLWLSGAFLNVTGDFRFLIEYERQNYADRLHILAFFCLIPASLPALIALGRRLRTSPLVIRTALCVLLVAWASGLTYASLPRHDAIVTGRGWSAGAYDFDAVRLIHADAKGRAYTSLANQSVSAAAVSVLGFHRYAGDVFFYPIPTGGKLYDVFLTMTYEEPSRDTAHDAAELGGSDLVYVVVNRYWWQSQQLSEKLREAADQSWTIPAQDDENQGDDDWQVRIYKFDFNTSSSASSTTSGS